MDNRELDYRLLIESHIDHLTREYHLWSDSNTPPIFYFLSVTFVPVEAKREDHLAIPPHRCFVLFEQFYVRLLSRLMNNFERKRWLQPLTYAYVDYPFTKPEKRYAILSAIQRQLTHPEHPYPGHPETTAHIHSVMLISPKLVARFKAVAAELEHLFRRLSLGSNRTLHAVALPFDELRDVMFYSSKLLKQPQMLLKQISKFHREPKTERLGERSVSFADEDLYVVLPKAKNEPVYVKAAWERELERAKNESRA